MNLKNYPDKRLAEIALIGSKSCIAQAEAVLLERFHGLLPPAVERQAPHMIVDDIMRLHYDRAIDVLARAVREPQTLREECLKRDVMREILMIEEAEKEIGDE